MLNTEPFTLQETSLRPDIRLGRVLTDSSGLYSSPLSLPPGPPDFSLPPPSNKSIDYNSAFLCSLPLRKIKPHPFPTQGDVSELRGADGLGSMDLENLGVGEVTDQSHLTRVVVGCEEDIAPLDIGTPEVEDVLKQVRMCGCLVKG